jgi:ATP-binding cassette subfamily F protein 3
MRIELAKLLLRKPDILLLDEPTNHLDIESIQWLENFLATQANAVILVSHDRAFIDNVTLRTVEISLGKIYDYRVNYSKYVELRKERREQQLRAYENQRKQIEDTEEFIERFRYKATKAVQVQSRIKQLDRLERIEVDEEDNSALRLKFPPAPRSGSYPVVIENLRKSYGDHLVFENATFTINRGEKVAFVGKNGEGKSTLLKCILEEIPYEGKLQLGHNVKIGYFAQNQADLMNEKLTVFETIDYAAVGDVRTKIRDILGAFMFGGEASDKKVAVLSGGERTRLAMIKLLLEPVNLLILDEPTNHLDMRSKDVLKEALKEFSGTAIIVSHDREFLDGLVDKVYEFGRQRVREHLGGIYEFLEKKKIENLRELEKSALPYPSRKETETVNIRRKQEQQPKLSDRGKQGERYEIRKEQQRLIKRLERNISDCEKKIEILENEINAMEEILSTPEGASNVDLLWKHAELQKKVSNIMNDWTESVTELENVKI